MRLFIVLLFLSGYFFSPAQPSTAYDFQPLSPTASELGKYGLIPINLATGAMSTDVPLYTLKTNKLSIPISLMYSSSGVKVNDISGHAGMNWVLNAGGAIVVIIRDEADEDFGSQGGEIPYPSNTTTMNVELAKYLESARLENFDSERDLYSFNFLGKTGKFVFDRKNTPLFVPYQAMQFGFDMELVTNDQGQQYYKRHLVLTDEAGIKYYFGPPKARCNCVTPVIPLYKFLFRDAYVRVASSARNPTKIFIYVTSN